MKSSFIFADLRQIFSILSHRLRLRAYLALFLMLVQGASELFFILTLSWLGLSLTSPSKLYSYPVFEVCFTLLPDLRGLCEDQRYLVLLAGCVVIAASIAKSILSWRAAHTCAALGEDISIAVGWETVQRFLHSNYLWHLSQENLRCLQLMSWRSKLALLLIFQLSLYSSVITMIILFMSLIWQEPLLCIFVLFSTISIGIALYRVLRKAVESSSRQASLLELSETEHVLCLIKGIREILLYQQQNSFLQTFTEIMQKSKKVRIFNSVAPTIPIWVLEALGFFVMVVTIAYLVIAQNADIPRIITAVSLLMLTAWRVLPYCNRVISYQVTICALIPMARPVIKFLQELRANPQSLPLAPDLNFQFSKGIELVDLSFRYPGAATASLDGISTFVPKGAKLGIVGHSGAGKSTLVNILCALLPPTTGALLVDGHELTASRKAAFMRIVGYVPQSPFLFAGSLAENVAFSARGLPIDEERVLAACAQASMDFISSHPAGIHMPLGENGSGLSGGQAQRLAIARALYTNPQILIFDEATSSLDQDNELAILATIKNLPDDMTTITIAHRLTSVAHCDLILWLDKGQLIQSGKPKTILPLYQRMSFDCHTDPA